MSTPLSVWLSAATSATLSTSNKLYASTGGSPSTVNNFTLLGTATGYGEVTSQGTASSWLAGGSIGTPTGKGFFLDLTTLDGQDLAAGSYTGNVRLASQTGTGGGSLGGSFVATIYYRVYKYSGGVYTNILTMSLASQTINATITTYALSGTTSATTSFANGDKLYVDIWLNVTSNSNGSTENIRLNRLTTDTSTFVGDTTATIVTPGYQFTSSPPTVLMQLSDLNAQYARIISSVVAPNIKIIATVYYGSSNNNSSVITGEIDALLIGEDITTQLHVMKTINDVTTFI